MPADIKKLIQDKDLIISTIAARGPSLPVQIAKAVGLAPLFASAYLSELYGEKKLKMSHMRVGSSPLYYVEGQESKLETFTEHLNHKEREALMKLKQEKIVEDSELHPANRVALRELKDFAVPVKVKNQDEIKLFWKYYLVPDTEMRSLLQEILNPTQNTPQKVQQPAVQPQHKDVEPVPASPPLVTQHNTVAVAQQALPEQQEVTQTKAAKPVKEKKAKKPKVEDLSFANSVKEHLQKKDIELLETVAAKKKECLAKIRLDTSLGKQEFYLIAKDKKKVTQEDLAAAVHRAHLEKMPAFFISPGTLDSDAETYLAAWKNLIKFEKIKA